MSSAESRKNTRKPGTTTRSAAAATGPGLTLTTGLVAAVLALLTVIFFREVVFAGRTFVSPDATAPLGFVRMGELSLWKDHVYPLWNPYTFLGMPSFGSGAYNPLIYPPDWPLAVVQKLLPLPEMTWLLLYYFLGAFFMWLLAREWGARSEAALVAAIAFVFQPNLIAVGVHGHGSQLVDSAYLPLMLWLASRWLRTGRTPELGWLALAGGFQFLRGHVQICFYTWMAIGLYALVQLVRGFRGPDRNTVLLRVLAIGAAAGLAFGVAGVYNLPLKDYAQYSMRASAAGGGAPLEYATSWSMAPYELPSLVFPNFVGFGGQYYWGGMPFTDYPNGFVGVIIAVLALCGLVARGTSTPGARPFAIVLGVLALLVAMGKNMPLYGLLYDHLPMFNKFRIPVMILILFQLATALAAAWGWTALTTPAPKTGRDPVERMLLVVAGLLAVCGGLGLFVGEGLRGWYVNQALMHNPQFPGEFARGIFPLFLGDLRGVAGFGLLLVGLAWLTRRGKLSVTLGSLAVVVLLLFELWPVSTQVMAPTIGDPVARNTDQGRDDVIQWLEQNAGAPGTYRVFYPESQWFQDNRAAGFGIAVTGGRHSAKTRLWQELSDRRALYQLPWNALLNARYWVFSRPFSPQDVPAGWADVLDQVYVGSSGVVYQFRLAMPRAMLLGAWTVVPDTGTAVIDSVSAVERNIAAHTYLTQDPGIPSGSADSVGTATITAYGLHQVAVTTEGSRPAVLRLADLYYPDWQVTVDGKPAPLLRADHALRAVAVPAGRHEVVFTFRSRAFTLGLWTSIVSAAIAVALLLLGRRRAPTPPSGPATGEGATA